MGSEKKVALVTGGGRGIGRAICVKLAKDGCNIVTTYTSSPDQVEETKKLCVEYGVELEYIKADVKDLDSIQELVKFAKEAFGRVDILVSNAGVTKDGLILSAKEEDFDFVIDTNLKGSYFLAKECAKLMIRQKSGRMIFLSSVVGVHGNGGQTSYSASKAGLIGLSKSLAKELAGRNITVNAVAPGFIGTDMTDVLPDEAKEGLKTQIPLGTIGKPEDVANAVSFLASDEAGYITGVTLAVDGGMGM